MKIELHNIKIRDIVEGYVNNDEEGVRKIYDFLKNYGAALWSQL